MLRRTCFAAVPFVLLAIAGARVGRCEDGGPHASVAKDSFTWPPPPVLGATDYFPIARQGQARCVVVYSKDSPEVRRSAEGLVVYLQRVTGGEIQGDL